MKKIVFFTLLNLTLVHTSRAQLQRADSPSDQTANLSLKASSTTSLVVDTLHYYFNKLAYKSGLSQVLSFPYLQLAAATSTGISHCGSRFDIPPGDSVMVSGLEAYARIQLGVNSFFKKPVHLYLCDLDAQGMPVLPPIDSITTELGYGAVTTPSLIGGNFNAPHKIKKSYAVLLRHLSLIPGDTIHFYRTQGATLNSPAENKFKYSETEGTNNYAFVRFLTKFYGTRDFTLAPGFGIGTQFEYVIAPRVSYLLQSSHVCPLGIESGTSASTPSMMCTREIMTFTTTSSKFFEHRMFNLNAFYHRWLQGTGFAGAPPSGFSPDSAITWSFECYDAAVPAKDARVFLPYANNGTISAQTDLPSDPGCFTANEFRTRLRPMGAFNKKPQIASNESFTLCLKYCNDDALGMNDQDRFNTLQIAPNPLIHGKTKLKGLYGNNTLEVYDLMGRRLLRTLCVQNDHEVNLTEFIPGVYLIKIENDSKQVKQFKVLND